MKTDGPRLEKLLRWYPRTWRERYGEEFLAMVEDTLDGRRPTLRLRAGVAWGGLRERVRGLARILGRKVKKNLRADDDPLFGQWWVFFVPGFVLASISDEFDIAVPQPKALPAMAILYAELAIAAFSVVAILTRVLIALPAFGSFLRAGGWPKIRRHVAWAVAATALACGEVAWLVLVTDGLTFTQLNQSSTFTVGTVAAGLLSAVAIGLWARAARTAARRFDLRHGLLVKQTVLATLVKVAIPFMLFANVAWFAVIQSSAPWLIFTLLGVTLRIIIGQGQIRGAIHAGRHRRASRNT